MKITEIKSFVIELAPTGENDYRYTTLGITQVFTDEGITGYGFRRTPDDVLNSQVRPGLIGKDPRNIIEILKSGALKGCATVENALWDISGKAANVPVRHLLGSTRERFPYYLTCVWPGNPDQSHLSLDEQAAQIAHYYALGHTKIKFRGWRPDPMDDVRVVEKVRALVGGRDNIE